MREMPPLLLVVAPPPSPPSAWVGGGYGVRIQHPGRGGVVIERLGKRSGTQLKNVDVSVGLSSGFVTSC